MYNLFGKRFISADQLATMHEIVGGSLDAFLKNVSTTVDVKIGQSQADMTDANKAIENALKEYKQVIAQAEAARDNTVRVQSSKYETAKSNLRKYQGVAAILK